MKKLLLLFVLFVSLKTVPVIAQTNCNIDEFVLLQEKPQGISDRDALSVIRSGLNKKCYFMTDKDTFITKQVFPLPINYECGYRMVVWLVPGGTVPYWQTIYEPVILGKESISYFLIVCWICSIVLSVYFVKNLRSFRSDGISELYIYFNIIGITILCGIVIKWRIGKEFLEVCSICMFPIGGLLFHFLYDRIKLQNIFYHLKK
ncbi:MAG: hypothetical protein WCQ32_02355 [bacterium]